MSSLAIYIPSVYANITESMISKTFHRMEIGRVKHVDLIDQGKTNKAHVYFDEIYDTEKAAEIACSVKHGKSIKLSYARNEHVFWIILQSRNSYDGKSNTGEFIDEVKFTDEEIAFMESHSEPDMSLVDANYASILENEIYLLRNTVAQLQMNVQLLQNNNMQQYNSSIRAYDCMEKWLSYASSNQMDRLRRSMLKYMGVEQSEVVNNVDDDMMDIEQGEIVNNVESINDGGKMTIEELAV